MSTTTTSSSTLFERALAVTPGGVNSPVRACKSVGGDPLFIASAEGAHVTSVDGQTLIDTIGSWGPMLVGHRHPEVVAAIANALSHGTSFGAPTELEVEFAETVCAAFPTMDKVRAVSSGTEATMSALRLARGFTGRPKIVKVDGGYHGHADFLLVAAGSGAATLGIPGSAGVPEDIAKNTLVVPYNDLAATKALFEANRGQIAAIIVEPVAGNMGVVAPGLGYLEGLRSLTREHGALLILDEVMTCFRVAYGGAQLLYNIEPDLTCLGKVIGGGLPAAAFGGRAEIMDRLAPIGDVYQAGTLSGNPLAMAAGLKTLEILRRPGTYEGLEAKSARLEAGLAKAARDAGIAHTINRVGAMLTLFFCGSEVTDYTTAKAADTAMFGKYFRGMRDRDVFLPPSQFEAMFLSTAHTDAHIDQIIAAAAESLRAL